MDRPEDEVVAGMVGDLLGANKWESSVECPTGETPLNGRSVAEGGTYKVDDDVPP